MSIKFASNRQSQLEMTNLKLVERIL